MKIIIGNDHASPDMKREIVKYLEELGHEVVNFGVDTTVENTLSLHDALPIYRGEGRPCRCSRGSGLRHINLRHGCWHFARCKQNKGCACSGVFRDDDGASGKAA